MNWLERKDFFDERLTKQDRAILLYVDQHKNEVQSMSSQALAEACYVSRSSISRLLRKLEIQSFAALKFLLLQETQSQKVEETDFSALVENYRLYIDQIFEKLDLGIYVQVLMETDILYLYGTGNAQKMEVEHIRQLFSSLGKRVVVFFDKGEFDFLKKQFTQNDLLLLLSYKGESDEALTILQEGKFLGLKTMVMTQTSNNHMAKLAHFQMYVPTQSIKTPTVRTYEVSTTFYFVIDQLYYAYKASLEEGVE